jgi:hypothetical protein
MNKTEAEKFVEQVDNLCEKVDGVLVANNPLACLLALSRLLGSGLAIDIVGHYPSFDTLDNAMTLIDGAIRAAYNDMERAKREGIQ